METESLPLTLEGSVRNEVTPSGVWKPVRSPGWSARCGVRNEVTPSGVWKQVSEFLCQHLGSVRNEVTPSGVWKRPHPPPRKRLPPSETRSRHRAYGNEF